MFRATRLHTVRASPVKPRTSKMKTLRANSASAEVMLDKAGVFFHQICSDHLVGFLQTGAAQIRSCRTLYAGQSVFGPEKSAG